MLNKKSLNPWQYLVVEPYRWLAMAAFLVDFSDESLPEQMTRRDYALHLLRFTLPFFTVLFPIVLVSYPVVALWNGYDIPMPFPFARLALLSLAAEAATFILGAFFPTRLGFLITAILGLAASTGLILGIALW